MRPTSKLNSKIQAFTLTELMVVLVLSGVLILITYQVLLMSQGYLRRYRATSEQIHRLQTLQTRLQADFTEAEFITEQFNRIICYSNQHTIQYTLEPDRVLRLQVAVTDTFFIAPQGIVYERLTLQQGGSLLQSVQFTIFVGEDEINFSAAHQYRTDIFYRKLPDRVLTN